MTSLHDALGAEERRTAADSPTIDQWSVDGPHGPLDLRVYRAGTAQRAGLVWVHGGGFAHGDLDMAESDDVARRLAARGIVVVCVDYRLAPIPATWASLSGVQARDGVHYPVASDEVEHAFRWASESGLTSGRWSLGGASAGANLATGAALRLVRDGGPSPALVLLAYPTLHAVQSAPGPELRAALDRHPDADRFGPAAVRAMYENYLGAPLADADISAVPGTANAADLAGFPRVSVVTADVDELRVSAEDFVETLREAGVDVDIVREPGSRHGYLDVPGDPAAGATIAAFARRLLDS